MVIMPLPKALYERAKKDEVAKIHLEFSGGNDQGYLNVNLDREGKGKCKDSNLAKDIELWAEDEYQYSGAGDGNDYGDNITYNLVNNKVSVEEWHMSRVSCGEDNEELVVKEDDAEDKE